MTEKQGTIRKDKLGPLNRIIAGVLVVLSYWYKITSLGVVLHEFSHRIVISWRGYRVYEVDYFSHVEHEIPSSIFDSLLVLYAPLVVNTGVSIGLAFILFDGLPASFSDLIPVSILDAGVTFGGMFLIVSFLFHSIPSLEDIENIKILASHKLKWYRLDLIFVFVILSPLYVPQYIGLLLSKKNPKIRVIIDFSFTIFVLLSIFGVFEWWLIIPKVDIIESSKELLVEGFKNFGKFRNI